MPRGPQRYRVNLFSRRDVLRWSGAAAGALLLPRCDRLHLPDRTDAEPAAPGEVLEPLTSNAEFYVQHCCGVPAVDGASWALRITDEEEELGAITLARLEGLAARDKEHTLQCIGSSPRYQAISNAVWSGLPLREVLEELGIRPGAGARHLEWTCADGYHTGLPREDLEGMWLVWRMNGEPLAPEHGFPARILNPGRYGTKNPKWPERLALRREPHEGFWESRGWSDAATYKPNGFIRRPGTGTEIAEPGTVRLLGTAFAGPDPVERVEVSDDGGQSFAPAELTYAAGPDVWTLWAFDWRPPGPGTYTLQVHVRTESGAESRLEAGNPLEGYDGGMRIELEVL